MMLSKLLKYLPGAQFLGEGSRERGRRRTFSIVSNPPLNKNGGAYVLRFKGGGGGVVFRPACGKKTRTRGVSKGRGGEHTFYLILLAIRKTLTKREKGKKLEKRKKEKRRGKKPFFCPIFFP